MRRLFTQQILCYMRCIFPYRTMYLVLLDLFALFECLEMINSPNVVNGQIFSKFKCPANNTVMCALDQPNKTLSFISREHCGSTCHTVLRWNWFNHIADEDPTRCMMGECQLFEKKPQNISQKARCSLYKVFVHYFLILITFSNLFQPDDEPINVIF